MASRPLESAQVRRGAAFSLVNSIGPIFLEKFAKFLQVVGAQRAGRGLGHGGEPVAPAVDNS